MKRCTTNCTLLNPVAGKTEIVSENSKSATSSGINDTAVETGSMVTIKAGVVDDLCQRGTFSLLITEDLASTKKQK